MKLAFWRRPRLAEVTNETTVCFDCLGFLPLEGYKAINDGRLDLVEKGVRCDFCERREQGKLKVRNAGWTD